MSRTLFGTKKGALAGPFIFCKYYVSRMQEPHPKNLISLPSVDSVENPLVSRIRNCFCRHEKQLFYPASGKNYSNEVRANLCLFLCFYFFSPACR